MSRPVTRIVLTALLFATPLAVAQTAQAGGDGPAVARWKPYLLSAANEIAVPAPPAENSAQTRAELDQLRLLQAFRSPLLLRAADNWNAVPVTQRWIEQTLALAAAAGSTPPRTLRALGLVSAAMHDAVVASYEAKFRYNRPAPSLLATDLTPAASMIGDPSYPSEHAAVAGAAAGTLAALFPKEAAALAALAREAGQARLIAGAAFPTDVEAGLALGQAVAGKAAARAASDGSDVEYTGTPPTGAGFWTGKPVEPGAGSWKTWLLKSGDQLRPPPPPAFGSPEFVAGLEEVKRINSALTPSERATGLFWQAAGGPFFATTNLLIARDRLSPARAARVWAAVGVGAADMAIADWEAKYHYWLLRPNQADPSIVPLYATPSYPSYPSGLLGFAGQIGDTLIHFFPQEEARIRYMQGDASAGRLYAGVHYRFDNDAALAMGRQYAKIAIERDRANGN